MIAAARTIQLAGIVLCLMNERDLSRCQCFIDLAQSETKERASQILDAALDNLTRLAEFGPASAVGATGPALQGRIGLLRYRAWRQLADQPRSGYMDTPKDNKPNYAERVQSLAKVQNYLVEERDRWQNEARQFEAQAFDQRGKTPVRRTAATGAVLGAILGIIPALITLLTTHPSPDSSGFPILNFFGGTAWPLFQWTGLGWLIGYSLPLMRGRNGSEKAIWLFIASIGAILPIDVIWSDSGDWLQTLIGSVELLIFLMAASVYLCDFRILRAARMRAVDWFTIQNWHFIVTWSTALIAAIGTAMVTFLSTTAADLSRQALPGPSSPPAAQSGANHHPSGSG